MANLLKCKPLDMLMREASETGEHSLKRALGPVNLITLGIGAIIGAGIFVLTGSAAAQYAGPAIVLSFVLAGLGCVFAGLCYSEFASLIPIAGSAYTYGYATLGETLCLDHRLGPDPGIRLRRGHRGLRLERLLRQLSAGLRHSHSAADLRRRRTPMSAPLDTQCTGAVSRPLGAADDHGADPEAERRRSSTLAARDGRVQPAWPFWSSA